jgi:hypothetical protein
LSEFFTRNPAIAQQTQILMTFESAIDLRRLTTDLLVYAEQLALISVKPELERHYRSLKLLLPLLMPLHIAAKSPPAVH